MTSLLIMYTMYTYVDDINMMSKVLTCTPDSISEPISDKSYM